ncbi:FAD-dependent oxidoreductase [Amycolatopsis mediterranei S699]|uniref:FAD-dependent oxidoreductase n=2 Tax=Amycolatopsis mediterranei TaxID=33910 RepID=A0A0H3D890_AMYMU|nr:FAD-dependent monooxygenase [Amycolatopsis mediterranei]ADJ45749.1 FAD-dependent oxidoreductase [Amycolatopsis mediterranei U32]AEK42530.1 FAD-dependent oxidoreductase [Amycolatopsis mediterranei S699]AFO77460.1 FAD-dependent oxidoreductase [Amycolatopsis mediterranei S699]AGT84588.1 FAD-dependent oxidoreductase [Amycolatopsis mediterranei RB]KDO05285.1 FAD-dependent oxidoreductase [Amycolatopsis mediterranei]
MKRVLISGASIAGPALAFWLQRAGFAVTIVEKAPELRVGGYPIDVRGTALDAVERMGILPRLRDLHISTRRLTFLDADGSEIAAVAPDDIIGGVEGEDLEVRRGDLIRTLYDLVRDDAEVRFGDTVETLTDHADGVDVAFRSGHRDTYDLVIGADGLHSRTRELVFGDEAPFHHYLGYCFAGFTMPNDFGLFREGLAWSTPGKGAALYAVLDSEELHGFLVSARPEPPLEAFRDPESQRDLIAGTFEGEGWEIPRMVAAMREADDLFVDVISQIHLPRWSEGRVALVGDAAHAPSFLTGQGTSLALAGAYLLGHALATIPDHTAAFAAYENRLRGFAEANQALVSEGQATLFPATAEALERRNTALRQLTTARRRTPRPEHSALTLPDFPVPVR